MKEILTLTCLIFLSILGNRTFAQTQQAPSSVTKSQNKKDTLIKATAVVTAYTDSSIAATMKDTAYLRSLSGVYRMRNSELVTIKISASNTLRVTLPGQEEHDLVTLIPIYFEVKDLPYIKLLFTIDRFGQARVVDIIDESKRKGSVDRQVSAVKQGKFRD